MLRTLTLRLRAYRYSRARNRILDAEHIAWAESLIVAPWRRR